MQAAGSVDDAGLCGAVGKYIGPSARTNRGFQDDKGWLDFTPRQRESFMRALQIFFQHPVEFLRVIHEQRVAVAVEALQLNLVAEL
jgi:hypothetical protein